MLRIAPARPVHFDEFEGALAEGAALGDGNPQRLPLSRLCVERVNSIVALFPVLCGLRARLRQRDVGEGTKPHVPPLAVELKTENPGLGSRNFDAADLARRRDAEVKPAAVMQHRRPLRPRYLNR